MKVILYSKIFILSTTKVGYESVRRARIYCHTSIRYSQQKKCQIYTHIYEYVWILTSQMAHTTILRWKKCIFPLSFVCDWLARIKRLACTHIRFDRGITAVCLALELKYLIWLFANSRRVYTLNCALHFYGYAALKNFKKYPFDYKREKWAREMLYQKITKFLVNAAKNAC